MDFNILPVCCVAPFYTLSSVLSQLPLPERGIFSLALKSLVLVLPKPPSACPFIWAGGLGFPHVRDPPYFPRAAPRGGKVTFPPFVRRTSFTPPGARHSGCPCSGVLVLFGWWAVVAYTPVVPARGNLCHHFEPLECSSINIVSFTTHSCGPACFRRFTVQNRLFSILCLVTFPTTTTPPHAKQWFFYRLWLAGLF